MKELKVQIIISNVMIIVSRVAMCLGLLSLLGILLYCETEEFAQHLFLILCFDALWLFVWTFIEKTMINVEYQAKKMLRKMKGEN